MLEYHAVQRVPKDAAPFLEDYAERMVRRYLQDVRCDKITLRWVDEVDIHLGAVRTCYGYGTRMTLEEDIELTLCASGYVAGEWSAREVATVAAAASREYLLNTQEPPPVVGRGSCDPEVANLRD